MPPVWYWVWVELLSFFVTMHDLISNLHKAIAVEIHLPVGASSNLSAA